MKQLLPLLFTILLYSCGHHTTGKGGEGDSTEVTEATIPAGDFYKRYEGTIAGKKVVANIERFGREVKGCYQYVGGAQALALSSWEDTVDDENIYLTESYGNGSQQDSLPHWDVQLVAGGIKGKWTSGDGQQQSDIDLKEAYPEGSYRLNVIYIKDSARLLESSVEPHATASYAAFVAAGTGGEADYINEQIRKTLEVADADIDKGLRNALKKYFDEYRQDNLELASAATSKDESWAFNFTKDEELRVLYNDKRWLVIEDLNNEYTGGAHGNNASSFVNIDAKGKRVWEINDVIADSASLKPLLNLAARNYFHMQPGEEQEQAMLVDEVPTTENFFILPEGITFVYNPYEIASYASGEVQLYIPYQKLMSLLTPQFKERMHLTGNAGVAML